MDPITGGSSRMRVREMRQDQAQFEGVQHRDPCSRADHSQYRAPLQPTLGGSQSCRNFLWESPLSFDGSSSSRKFKPGTLHSDDTRTSEDSTNWGARSHVRIGLDAWTPSQQHLAADLGTVGIVPHVRIKASSMHPVPATATHAPIAVPLRILPGPYMCPVGGPVDRPWK